jgi:hypothetical protein
MHYHGISSYQFYTAFKCVKEDRIPERPKPLKELQFTRQKSNECEAFLARMVAELAEDLPTGFKLEFPQRVHYF